MKTKFNNWFNQKFGWFLTNGNKQPYISTIFEEDLKNVAEVLSHATEYGLEVEVVAFALKYMKENPKLTITEAITLGYFEWVK